MTRPRWTRSVPDQNQREPRQARRATGSHPSTVICSWKISRFELFRKSHCLYSRYWGAPNRLFCKSYLLCGRHWGAQKNAIFTQGAASGFQIYILGWSGEALGSQDGAKMAPRPRWRILAPDSRILTQDWRILAPDWRILAPDWRILAPDWRMLAPDWRILAPE